jgi:hypothetical protein
MDIITLVTSMNMLLASGQGIGRYIYTKPKKASVGDEAEDLIHENKRLDDLTPI